ncbi:MAG: hypothetical protein R2815_09870 [Flavobacteriales bacterium]|nr:hypothetical protein [Flavobacteriales bacterium]
MKALVLSLITPLLLVGAIAQAQTCSFMLVSSSTNASGNTRMDSIAYSFNGPDVAIRIHGGPRQPDVRLIFDPAAGTITQLHEINGRKGGFVFPMSEKRWPGMPHSTATTARPEPPSGQRTRTIDGHDCLEVKVNGTEYTGIAWVAEDIPLSMERVFSYQSVGGGKQTKEADQFAEFGLTGLPLEMQLTSAKNGSDIRLKVAHYTGTVDASLFDTSGHTTSLVEE